MKKGSTRKLRTFIHYLKSGRITARKPKGCYKPSKGTKIKVKGQPDARVKICHDKPKAKKSGKKGKKK